MAKMSPLEYAKKYWELEVPIINDNNEIVSYEKVNFKQYRLHMGWKKPPEPSVFPPGHQEFMSAVNKYAYGLFKQGKRLELVVKNIWGYKHFIQPDSSTDKVYQRVLWRAALAFSGKGSPEDVQLTLQLAARCGVATKGLQQYCDETVDKYSRLGLDCNGFVGNYLCYRDSKTKWNPFEIKPPALDIHGETGIQQICNKLSPIPVMNVDDMLNPRIHVLGLVDGSGTVIDRYAANGGVGHIMILEAVNSAGKQRVYPPVPQPYLNDKYLWYMGVEATPSVGLSRIAYIILKIAKNGVATVWRDKVNALVNVKIYPVN